MRAAEKDACDDPKDKLIFTPRSLQQQHHSFLVRLKRRKLPVYCWKKSFLCLLCTLYAHYYVIIRKLLRDMSGRCIFNHNYAIVSRWVHLKITGIFERKKNFQNSNAKAIWTAFFARAAKSVFLRSHSYYSSVYECTSTYIL